MRPAAYISTRPKTQTFNQAMANGLSAAGFNVHLNRMPGAVRPGDIYCIWNRRGPEEMTAKTFERAGGRVLVAENGYLPGFGYALSLHHHNGGGRPLVKDPSRAAPLLERMKPWREDGEYVLVLPNRFIGPKAALMPSDWVEATLNRLKKISKRPLVVKPHPGHWKRMPPGKVEADMAEYLSKAFVSIIWWSSAGVRSLLAGVPVIWTAPYWIGGKGGGRDLDTVNAPVFGDRVGAFEDVANAQLTIDEIASGRFFHALREEQCAA